MANQVPSKVVETLYQIAGGDYAGVIGRLRTNERIAKFVTMFADDASYATLIDKQAKLPRHCAPAMLHRPKSSYLP